MKKNVLKKIAAAAIVLAMAMSMAACSSGSTASSAPAGSSTAASEAAPSEAASEAAPTAGEALTEDAYKAEMLRIYNEITEKSAGMASIDMTDPTAAIAAMKPIIADVTPLYNEMAALVAPESFKDTQATIAEGATASAELLDLSRQMLEVATGETSGDATKMQADLQTKIAELTPKATAFGEALTSVIS